LTDFRRTATFVAAAILWGTGLAAQAPSDSTLRRQQRTIDSLAAVLRSLQARMDSLAHARAGGDTGGGDELAALRAAASATSDSAASSAGSRPQQARLGQNALNPEISVTGDFRASGYRNAPEPNFVAREFEIGLQSALDPFTTAKITASFGADGAHIEEGYLFFPVLPGHIRLDLGRFRQEVGELNRWHLHAVPEDEYPLVVRRYSGGDGVSGTGASIYYTLPSGRLGTYELYLQGVTGDDSLLYAGGHHPAVNAKLAAFWQLSRATYLMASLSGAYGTNPDTSLRTTLGVAALRFTWRPPNRGTARELTMRGELWRLERKFNGAGAARLGGYGDMTWKMGPRWIIGVRGDYVQSPDPVVSAHEWAFTPSLTFWQSEFVFLRALWEHARDTAGATRDRLTLQAVFAMGPHKHELF
jgi:hypothetical protein